MNIFLRIIKHFCTITKHKFLVTKYCFKVSLYKQGILHDLSKYSPIEFFSGVKYYQGFRSPIDAEKEEVGYSKAWLHHKGINKHHWEYWYDNSKDGYIPLEMPLNYIIEMICDRISACKVYMKENYNDSSAYEYFIKNISYIRMHPKTLEKTKYYLEIVKNSGEKQAIQLMKNDVIKFKKDSKSKSF